MSDLKLSLAINEYWSISLCFDEENTIIAIMDKDDEKAASIPLDDMELALFAKQLELIIDAKKKTYE